MTPEERTELTRQLADALLIALSCMRNTFEGTPEEFGATRAVQVIVAALDRYNHATAN